MSTEILETIHWSENECASYPEICKNSPFNCSKSTSTSHDNSPILQNLYPILDSLNTDASNLENKHLDVIIF